MVIYYSCGKEMRMDTMFAKAIAQILSNQEIIMKQLRQSSYCEDYNEFTDNVDKTQKLLLELDYEYNYLGG